MKECITHHHACDCREAEFKSWKAAKDEWKARAECAEAARDIWKGKLDVCLEQARQVLVRAERAEALLREAFRSDWSGPQPGAWLDAVRALLEKT